MSDIEKLLETVSDFMEDSERLVCFPYEHAQDRAFTWFLSYAKNFSEQKEKAIAEIGALKRECDDLRVSLKWALYIIEQEVEATDKTKHEFAITTLAKGESK